MLTKEQAREAVTLAMKIETGCIDFDYLFEILSRQPELTTKLVVFWLTFNDMTRRAIQTLVYERCRMHLERCFMKEV